MTLEGNPWFHAGDVCDILGLSNASGSAHNLSTLDTAEVRNVGKADVAAGSDWPNRGASAVSESGLYSLIFRSKKPQAKDFKNYVTKEVLPSIRKTGSFVTGQPSLVENPQMSKTTLAGHLLLRYWLAQPLCFAVLPHSPRHC